MTTTATLNGTNYDIPDVGDEGWGSEVTNYLVAISTACLQKSGGSFTLTADVDFGASKGLKTAYYKSQAASLAQSGILRLGNDESVVWRDQADSADLALKVDTSDNLTFNGLALSAASTGSADTVLQTDAAGTGQEWGKIANANVAAAAAIAYSKLNLTGSVVDGDLAGSITRTKLATGSADHVLINDGSGDVSSEAQLAISRGGTGAATASAGFNALSPLTTQGDLLYGGASGAGTRLAVGSADEILKTDGSSPSWTKIVNANIDAAAAIARSKLASGTADHVVINDGTGAFSSEAALAKVRGGTGQDNSSLTFPGSGTIMSEDSHSIDKLSDVDTTTSAPSNGEVLKWDGSNWVPGTDSTAAINTDTKSVSSANYTVTDVDGFRTILVSTGASDRTITLPTAADNDERILGIKKTDSGAGKVIVDGEGAETVDGNTTVDLVNQYDAVSVHCDGTEWHIISDERSATSDYSGLVKKNRWGEKILQSDQNSTGDFDENGNSNPMFTNLTIGNVYRITGQVNFDTDGGASISIGFYDQASGAGNQLGKTALQDNNADGSNPTRLISSLPPILFEASTADVYANAGGVTASEEIRGDGTKDRTYFTIEELNNYEAETTDFDS